jgi:hypothetical protein
VDRIDSIRSRVATLCSVGTSALSAGTRDLRSQSARSGGPDQRVMKD